MLAKSTSLILSVFVLSQSFNLHLMDVTKLANLLEHIEFHESTYGDDIFSFVSKHYGDKVEEHKEQKDGNTDHQNLPFNHGVCADSGQLFVAEVPNEKTVFTVPTYINKVIFTYDDFYSFLKNTDIFQPPRLA
jgi:hypothetical protein